MQTLNLINKIEFKYLKNKKQFREEGEMHYLLYIVLLDMAMWHNDNGYTMTVTDLISTLEKDITLGRESDAHRTGRAADLRSRHMDHADREAFKTLFNEKYKDIASVSRSDSKARLVVEHGEGYGRHFHVALNYKYRIEEL